MSAPETPWVWPADHPRHGEACPTCGATYVHTVSCDRYHDHRAMLAMQDAAREERRRSKWSGNPAAVAVLQRYEYEMGSSGSAKVQIERDYDRARPRPSLWARLREWLR